LGGQAEFESLIEQTSALGLGWLQDIVPNHASYSIENKRVYDLWAKGAGSAYACYFDIDWNHPSPKLYGKPMVPYLAQSYMRCLKQGQITLIHKDDGFKIKYGPLEFPVNAGTEQHLKGHSSIQQTLETYNSNPQFLNALLSKQYYRLAHWKTALKHINYRRFFDIIDLIGVRIENPATYEDWHHLIFELTKSDIFSGLRVDHIDGLYEPEAYLENLRARCPDAYLIVEKILTGDEQLPKSWPVEGTTGYEFLNYVNKLFVESANESAFDGFYGDSAGDAETFSDLLYTAKKMVVEGYFLGDVHNLERLFRETLGKLAYDKPVDRRNLTVAVVEVMACFPVYRSYLDQKNTACNGAFELALWLAEKRNSQLSPEFSAITYILKQANTSAEAMHALKRFQQFTSAVMAKGFEDTALYRYTRLLSLNEVGSNPAQFGVSTQTFHEFNRFRQQNWPYTLNSTSTHDTKRGEDVRARLNVLSEIPDELRINVNNWAVINTSKKKEVNGKPAPDHNEEYYLYQTLLGAYPWDTAEIREFTERMKQHMTKALREAKVHTSWIEPNPRYEGAITAFTEEILSDERFLEAFLPFQKKIAFYGFYNTLAQTLLKITCPGVPDFYQGTELWDLNLVDPDNRRPVDFKKRLTMLSEVVKSTPDRAYELLSNYRDGKAKLYVIYRTLQSRKNRRSFFEESSYLPLAIKGTYAKHAVAFSRKKGDAYVLTVAPRFLTKLLYIEDGASAERDPATSRGKGAIEWADTYISLPERAPARWVDAFTGKIQLPCCGRLSLRTVLESFPVALLWGDSSV
jgi:(1->4)-alpha-D-glucan 1-alpha-D-glucosylmutase